MLKCNCKVCTIGNWLKNRASNKVCSSWVHDGFDLEGVVKHGGNAKLLDRVKYKLHFVKIYVWFKYL